MSMVVKTWLQQDEASSSDGLVRDAHRKYRYYFVQLDRADPQYGADVALGSEDLPQPGDAFNDGGGTTLLDGTVEGAPKNLLVWNRRADIHDRNRFLYRVTVEYASNEITTAILNGTLEPWGRQPLYDWDEKTYTRALVRDYNVDPNFAGGIEIETDPDTDFAPSSTAYRQIVQTSAKNPFADPIMHEVGNPVVRIRQAFQVDDWDYETIATLQQTVNDAPVTIQGTTYKAGQCKLNLVQAPESIWSSPLDGSQTAYYDTTLIIEIAQGSGQEPDDEDAANDFAKRVQNVDYHYRDSDGVLKRCMVTVNVPGQASYQIPSATPLPLDPETGNLWTKKNDDGTPADIPLLTFFPHPYADWTPLGLTDDEDDDG